MEDKNCIRIDANVEQISYCKLIINELNSSFHILSNILNLTGNTVRLKILYLLFKEKELCVCDLSDILEMKISAISQHLRKLKDRNIIQPNRKAQTIFYSLSQEYVQLLIPFFKQVDENK